MLIDCLCVTTSKRKSFKNWLLWNYLKQSHAERNLIVVSDDDDWPDWVKVIAAGISESIPTKRNLALAAAGGDAVTWFDDDDWQHPNKLQLIAKHIDINTNVGCSKSFFYDLSSGKIAEVDLGIVPLFNSIGVSRHGLPAFNETIRVGSDTDWLRRLAYRGNYIVDELLFFWITHDNNFTNPRHTINASDSLVIPFDGETWQNLRKLEANLKLG